MKHFEKLLAMALALVMMLAFASCGEQTGDTTATTAADASVSTEMSDGDRIIAAAQAGMVGNWGLGNEYEIQALLTKYGQSTDYRSYHGSTYGAGNLTGEPRRYPLEPGAPGFIKFFDPYVYREKIKFDSEKAAADYYVAKLREQIIYEGPDSVAAIVMETITGSNGVIIPPEGYLKGVRKICDEFGIMMICDEVMAGFGRTGKMFAFENFDVKPDIVSFAKGVTCGYVQLGGVCVSKKIAEFFDDHLLSCGLTYSGHPLACAAGVACLNFYKETNILENVNKSGKVLGEILEALKAKHKCVGDVRYIGLFAAVELVKDKETREPLVEYGKDPDGIMSGIIGSLKKRGFMTYSHENMILIAPPLIITPEQVKEEMVKLDEVLGEVDNTL